MLLEYSLPAFCLSCSRLLLCSWYLESRLLMGATHSSCYKSASARELTSQRVTLDEWRQELDNSKVGPHLALEISYISTCVRASLVAQMGKNPPAMPETQV